VFYLVDILAGFHTGFIVTCDVKQALVMQVCPALGVLRCAELCCAGQLCSRSSLQSGIEVGHNPTLVCRPTPPSLCGRPPLQGPKVADYYIRHGGFFLDVVASEWGSQPGSH
jgi:hypothetical protein